MRANPLMRSRSIVTHLLSWAFGLVALALFLATGIEYFQIACLIAATTGFLSSVAALPAAIHALFRFEQWAFWTRVSYGLVATMAAMVLVGGVVGVVSFMMMTAERH